jgi:hypothetical protein
LKIAGLILAVSLKINSNESNADSVRPKLEFVPTWVSVAFCLSALAGLLIFGLALVLDKLGVTGDRLISMSRICLASFAFLIGFAAVGQSSVVLYENSQRRRNGRNDFIYLSRGTGFGLTDRYAANRMAHYVFAGFGVVSGILGILIALWAVRG